LKIYFLKKTFGYSIKIGIRRSGYVKKSG